MLHLEAILTAPGLDALIAKLPLETHNGLQEVADAALTYAQDHAAVRTGAMKESLRIEQDDPFNLWVLCGNEKVNYSLYVELGTVHMRAQPFFIPAAEKAATVLDDVVEKLKSLALAQGL